MFQLGSFCEFKSSSADRSLALGGSSTFTPNVTKARKEVLEVQTLTSVRSQGIIRWFTMIFSVLVCNNTPYLPYLRRKHGAGGHRWPSHANMQPNTR